MNASKKAIALVTLSAIAILSYAVLRIMEMALPGLPVLVPLYIGILYFVTHSTLSDRRASLLDGPDLYDNHRLANLVIIGGLFSALVLLLRHHLEKDIVPDLHLSLLYWQLLFGFLASALIPKLIILNHGIIESVMSIKPYLPLLVVWIISFGLMNAVNHSAFSVAVITVTTVSLAVFQFKSLNAASLTNDR